jgi:hypothetical protein
MVVKPLPSVGMRGYFELSAPYDNYQINKTVFTCKAVRNINEYDRENKSLFSSVYSPVGLTSADFRQDKKNNEHIVSLQGEAGQWIIVPAKYITRFPEVNGVLYHGLMLGVSLGALPVDKDLDPIVAAISNVVNDLLGVEATIKPVQVSKTVIVPHGEHVAIDTARAERAIQKMSDAARVSILQTQIDRMRNKIATLEQYIIEHHISLPPEPTE